MGRYRFAGISLALLCSLLILISACGKISNTKNVESMSPDELDIAMKEEMQKTPPNEMSAEEKIAEIKIASSISQGEILKRGKFEGRAHDSKGEIKIFQQDGESYLVLGEDFKTDAGPDLHVVITEHPDPKNSMNLHEGEYADLGPLKSTTGVQMYKIPKNNVGKFNTASIYCKPFKVIFGIAKLK